MSQTTDLLEKIFDAEIVVKDRGNRGYYIKSGDWCIYVTKQKIINYLTIGCINERKRKLITIQIMND